ncbi:MAG: aldehyde ferredoxin oxidoreductase family protein [Anaerolineae bacterium]|nr:aldehyde ferredoxin oxidoreductase family protein [Anaerolineae bacterium]
MRYGHTGKVLRVDLTRGTIATQVLDEELYRMYPGGKALAAYLLLSELPKGVDPLGPENMLVLSNGLLTGAPFSTATRFTAAAKSPLTGGYGESEAGGFWGPELKMAGYEAIVITGRAASPVYLWIKDDHAEIRPADHLWGREPEEAQATIRAELGDKLIRVLQIGLGGMGAVMGSKNLKGIAVRGSTKYLENAAEPSVIADLGKTLAKRVKENPLSWDLQVKGTPGLTAGLNASGILPTRNFRAGAFEGVDNIRWEQYESQLLSARRSCYACAVRCKREVKVDDRYQVSDNYGGPEYEAVSGFGSNCGIDDLQAIAKANELCGRYTMDAISCASVVSFAMECYEHELIGPEQTGGLELRFGNAEAMVRCVEMIARREGIGDLLAEGAKRAAAAIGGDAHFFAMQVKGQELPMHDPRGKVGVGLSYATSETGAEHLTAFHDAVLANPDSLQFKGVVPLGISEPLPPRDFSRRKVEYYTVMEHWNNFGKTNGLCYFGPAPRSFIAIEEVVDAVNAAAGWDLSLEEMLRIGERANNLTRVFNAREGFTRKDDTLPERLFTPLEAGALQGVSYPRDEFERALSDLYEIKGWDVESGVPTREKLRELGIEWAADLI